VPATEGKMGVRFLKWEGIILFTANLKSVLETMKLTFLDVSIIAVWSMDRQITRGGPQHLATNLRTCGGTWKI
jgi:hypothetical protein